ncbi:hypothetical protein MRX96_008580 [Rhipicephalus microplus]
MQLVNHFFYHVRADDCGLAHLRHLLLDVLQEILFLVDERKVRLQGEALKYRTAAMPVKATVAALAQGKAEPSAAAKLPAYFGRALSTTFSPTKSPPAEDMRLSDVASFLY